MVHIIRKGSLPLPSEVPQRLRAAAAAAALITVREQRPTGFPLFFSDSMQLIEPAIAYLHEHAVQRAHAPDTVRTYAEVLYDWFDTLEQSGITWDEADGADLVAYRNRMLTHSSSQTGRAYSIRTVNQRVQGVLRFYQWAVRAAWLPSSPLIGRRGDFAVARRYRRFRGFSGADAAERSVFLLRQFEALPRPLTSTQARTGSTLTTLRSDGALAAMHRVAGRGAFAPDHTRYRSARPGAHE